MSTFRSNKFVYEEILEVEELYNNTPMEYIKKFVSGKTIEKIAVFQELQKYKY